ncbi:MAG: hypothetical protein KDA24_26120, partial [Deltaproteobacteria bacterium]|nr:hypothetical protein [Deltaproteobacteria bacterium]
MLPRLLLATALVLTGCPAGGDDDDATSYPDIPLYDFEAAAPWFECPDAFEDGTDEVRVFDRADQYFGDENLRDIRTEAELPTGDFAQVGLWLELRCPGGNCDDWDRAGSIQMAVDPDDPDGPWRELARFVTPYDRGMCQYIDVTPLASVLQGRQLFGSWIDTWVGPGHAQGDGWVTSVSLVYTPGEPARSSVIDIWGRRSITVGEVEPEANVQSQIEPVVVAIPAEARRVRAHVVTTGHSFGNTANCAEFCAMQHDVIVNDELHTWDGWRDDCDANPISPQN